MSQRERAFYRLFGADATLARLIAPASRVLDVGCSDGTGSMLLSELHADAVDIHAPSLVQARDTGRRGRCLQADILALPVADASYDLVTCLDVIEHLPKKQGWQLLDELERVARGHVVVLTPYGFCRQPAQPDQPWMEHRSGWWPSDFRARGYRVVGNGGVRFARVHEARGAFRWGTIGKLIGTITASMVRVVPGAAYNLIAVKPVGPRHDGSRAAREATTSPATH
jgi:SAM-dependent methyltransferase